MFTTTFPSPFRSFWWAGYECTDQLNCFGHRVDLLSTTGHLSRISDDYADLAPFNIQTAREGIRWSRVEQRPYQYDWSDVFVMLRAGQRAGVQQVWDLCHFGYPDDLTPLHPMFARRFAHLCRAFVRFYRDHQPDGPLIITPINEVSFISWLGGDARGTSPYCVGMGWEVKYALMRAYVEGVAALRDEDPNVVILSTEPLVNIGAPLDATDEQLISAAEAHNAQFQAMDILTGRMCPELGGQPDFLDVLGLNFYYNNQWIVPTYEYLPWGNEANDPRFRTLRSLLTEAHERYQLPIALTETSHPGEHRPNWVEMIGRECAATLQRGIPLLGACLYPIIDRPDWDFVERPWHRSGLWDAQPDGVDMTPEKTPGRHLCQPYADALLMAQDVVAEADQLLTV